MMSRTTQKGPYRRIQSVVLLSDDDDDDDNSDDHNKINTPIQTQYATPMAHIDEDKHIDTKPLAATRNQLPIVARRRPSFLILQRQPVTTVTTEPNEIDLRTPMKSPCGLAQRNYLPYTLTSLNRERLSILPRYPPADNSDDDDDQSVLLLVNVPINQLSQQERTRREQGQYKCQFFIRNCNAFKKSFIVQQYKTFYGSIIERLNIDLSILDYNYLRLKKFIRLCQLACIRVLPANRSSEVHFNLSETEFPQLLEFYLQIDIDLFYMKTCSFRQASPRTKTEGIFCTTNPECRYVMEPCGNCPLCYSSNQSTNSQQYSMAFNLYQRHRFVNGYESILNGPASCNTINIIYALTCQCGNYDYIGDTGSNLLKRLSSHRCFTHRLILEKLIGEKNYVQFWGGKTNDMAKKDSMRLYQHPMHCSSVIQSFLNKNLDYWIFVPMLIEDADQGNMSNPSTTVLPSTKGNHNGNTIQRCLDALPKPPTGYKFSKVQIKKQYEFFAMKHYQKQPNVNYIVYRTTIIAVLPLNTSDLFRRLIHSLLVTHTEAKLNTLGHLFTYPLNAPINQGLWCANLRRPRS